jgi:hypothetical protein
VICVFAAAGPFGVGACVIVPGVPEGNARGPRGLGARHEHRGGRGRRGRGRDLPGILRRRKDRHGRRRLLGGSTRKLVRRGDGPRQRCRRRLRAAAAARHLMGIADPVAPAEVTAIREGGSRRPDDQSREKKGVASCHGHQLRVRLTQKAGSPASDVTLSLRGATKKVAT